MKELSQIVSVQIESHARTLTVTPMRLLKMFGFEFREGVRRRDITQVYRKNAPDMPLVNGRVRLEDIDQFLVASRRVVWDIYPLFSDRFQRAIGEDLAIIMAHDS